jgi:hypothetical protein
VVHLAWCGNAESLMYSPAFHRELLPDSGWRPVEIVSEYACGHSNAAIACDSAGNLCLSWAGYDLGASVQQIFCRRRVSGVWQATEFVSNNTGMGSQYLPAVSAGADGWFGVGWYGVLNSWQRVFYRQCTPARWMDVEEVSGGVWRQQRHASVACRGEGEAWAAWCGQDSAVPACYQLRFSRRNLSGDWSAPETLTSLEGSDAAAASVAHGPDSSLHVVWHDDHAGNNDIYYRHGAIPVGIAENVVRPRDASETRAATVVAGNWLRLAVDCSTRVTLLDAAGRIVAERSAAPAPDGTAQVSIAGLSPGIYFVRSDERHSVIARFTLVR